MKIDVVHPRPKINISLSVRDAYIVNMRTEYILALINDRDVENHPWLEFSKDERKVAIDFNHKLAELVDEYPEYS